jgi:glucose/arabinose dehydrogenase
MNHTIHGAYLRKALIFSLFFSIFLIPLKAQLPSGFTDIKAQSGYAQPMGVIFTNNGQKMFVWEKKGVLWCSNWNGSTYVKQATPVLNISDEVADWRDFGFQSVCLDPNFDSNGLIYLYYQVDRHHLFNFGTPQYNAATDDYFKASISRVTRYKVTNNVAEVASRKVLLGETRSTGVPLLHESHAGGQIVFGTDGTLLVTTGDNASYASTDVGNANETYFQQAINDGIIRSTENVGALRSQMINSHCGKLLRLDPNTGDGVSSNPYYDSGSPRSAKSRVWALGLRNPYRISFKSGTGSTNPASANPGTVIIGDVQNGSWEELHMVEKGGINCGWPIYEGHEGANGYFTASANVRNQEETGSPTFQSLCVQATSLNVNGTPNQRRFTHFPPALDWNHGNGLARFPNFSSGRLVPETIGTSTAVTGTSFSGNCVTAGTFYRGSAFPAEYQNIYFFADYGANWIKAATVRDNNQPQFGTVKNFAPNSYGKGIVDIEYNPLDQSIFYVNINSGDIQKISYGVTNRPPVAAVSANKTSGASPLVVNFSSNGSSDPDGDAISYDWNFGDGTANSTSANPSHTFTSTGAKGFTVTLTVKDSKGLTDSKTITISTNNTAPSVKITNPTNATLYSVTQANTYTLNASVTDNDAAGMQYAWQVTLVHNNHEHREPIINQVSPTVQISPVGCDGETYYYLIELTVKDNGGLTAKDAVKINPNCSAGSLSVTNVTATAQQNAARVNWTNPTIEFDEIMVVAKATSGFITNPSGTSFTADANFTGGGTGFEGGKVVYKGTGTTVTVSNLTANTKYFFRVFTRKGTTWTGGVEASATPTGAVTPPPPPPPTTTLGCLKGSYFNNRTLSGNPIVVRAESSINYNWGSGSPASSIGADNFSARWEGTVVPPTTGTYTFKLTGDDGIRLWVNGSQIINKWFDQGSTSYTATINLTKGQNVPIKVEYYENGGGANVQLAWSIPGQSSQVTAFSACPLNNLFDPNKCYRLTNRLSGKVLEVPAAATTRGAQLAQYPYVYVKHHLWKIKIQSDGSYRLVNANSGLSADVFEGLSTENVNIIQWDWTGGNNQRWTFTRNSEGYFYIRAKHSNKAMDLLGDGTANGVRIVQRTIDNTNSQQWRVEEISCPSGSAALESENILAAEGYREGKKAVLTWVSNANNKNDYFIVEKLNPNGPTFEKVVLMNAQYGAAGSVESYKAYDNEPNIGENVYRIALFREGATLPQYSDLIALDFSHFNDFVIFPNPANDYIDVDLDEVRFKEVDITITDISGKVMKTQHIDSAPNAPVRMTLEGMGNGSYFMRIDAEGRRGVVKQFVIRR